MFKGFGPARQVAALRGYRASLAPLIAQLGRLKPPPLLVPLHTNQLQSLRRVGAIAGQLAVALERQNGTRVGPLLSSFEQASAATTSIPAQRAQIAAIRSYNRRLDVIHSVAARIRSDQAALDDALG